MQYPHVFEDNVLENIKNWVVADNLRFSADECDMKHDLERNKPTDSEMLGTYATGLLAICLAGYASSSPSSVYHSLCLVFVILFLLSLMMILEGVKLWKMS